ncbi:MAG: FkbM family methyltransferase [Alphaproteobacteria bacterium]|nr:FkbM family methyltransferase [Alphaproteobacteria bacterium]
MTAGGLKRAIEGLAGLAGIEIVPKWRAPTLAMARKLSLLFDHLAISSVIDIGANEGQYRNFLRNQVGFTGAIFSFEPDPDLSDKLMRRAAEDAKWRVFPFALGPAEGVQLFNRMGDKQFNSFHEPSPDQPVHVRMQNRVVSTVPVTVRTLDGVAAELGELGPVYVKIDTQGFDLEVLKGGRNVIRSALALQTEVSLRPVYSGSPSFAESIAAFQAEGFAIADLFIVASDGQMRAVEFDCVMVRDPDATVAHTGATSLATG